jgi:hypothetical protein
VRAASRPGLELFARRVPLGLRHDVHADDFAPRGEEPPGDRAGGARTDPASVHPGHGQDAGTRAREERLIGCVDVVGLEILLDDGDAELARQVTPAPACTLRSA